LFLAREKEKEKSNASLLLPPEAREKKYRKREGKRGARIFILFIDKGLRPLSLHLLYRERKMGEKGGGSRERRINHAFKPRGEKKGKAVQLFYL